MNKYANLIHSKCERTKGKERKKFIPSVKKITMRKSEIEFEFACENWNQNLIEFI